MNRTFARLATVAAALAATPALAHHPLAGAPMSTFGHGVLSGIGHPILGFDHLAFVIAMGIAAVYTGRALIAPLGYVAAMLVGVLVCYAGVALPAVELVIALSLVVVGTILAMGRALSPVSAMGLFALLGLFHGWAFGVSIAAQESASVAVMGGYLLGLGATQWLLAVVAGMVALRIWKAAAATDMPARLAGAAVAGIGGFLVLEQAEGAVFAALGLG